MAEREVNYTSTLIFSVTIAVIGNSFLYGYNIGVVNNPADVIRKFYADTLNVRARHLPLNESESSTVVADGIDSYNVTGENMTGSKQSMSNLIDKEDAMVEILWAITVSIFVLFGMIGVFVSGKVADSFGRKQGMIMITVLMLFAAFLGGIPIFAKSLEVVIVHRAFVGLHCGINVSLASLYLVEISPKKIRGAVGTIHQLFITIGILWSNIMGVTKLFGSEGVWPWVFAFNAFPALVCLICLPFCPESPRFLLINKAAEQKARDALRKLRGYEDVEDEIDEMKLEARRSQSAKSFTIKKLLTTPELKIPIIIAVVLQMSQPWSGINAVMSYSSFMYKNVGLPGAIVEWVVCSTSAINVVTTVIAVPLMEKLGRRKLLMGPMTGMLLSFGLLTIFHNLQYADNLKDQFSSFALISMIVAIHTYVFGFALGLVIVVSELFRQEPRTAAMSFSLTFNWICNFTLMMGFRFMQKAMLGFVYMPFIVTLILAITFIFFMVPETKNNTFDDIANSIAFSRKKDPPAFCTKGSERPYDLLVLKDFHVQ